MIPPTPAQDDGLREKKELDYPHLAKRLHELNIVEYCKNKDVAPYSEIILLFQELFDTELAAAEERGRREALEDVLEGVDSIRTNPQGKMWLYYDEGKGCDDKKGVGVFYRAKNVRSIVTDLLANHKEEA